MVVAVTGGRGYVGERIVASLVQSGWRVRLLTRERRAEPMLPSMELVKGDLESRGDLERLLEGANKLVHAGGAVRVSDPAAFRVNVEAARNLAAILPESAIQRTVVVSSAGVFGRPGHAVTESAPHLARDAYERSKSDAEGQLTELVEGGSVRLVRPSVVIGGQNPTHPLLRLAHRLTRRQVIPMNSHAWTNYVPIEVVVECVLRALDEEAAPSEVNVNCPLPMDQFVPMLASVLAVDARGLNLPPRTLALVKPLIGRLIVRSERLSPVAALMDSTRFKTEHPEWLYGDRSSEERLKAGLSTLVEDYRRRGLL